MYEYALIFRRTAPLDPADLPARNAAARDWALALKQQGVLRSAAPLEDDGRVVSLRGAETVSNTGLIASVLVIEAESLDAAVRLAEGHPGLAFGVEIEIRPVKVVGPTSSGDLEGARDQRLFRFRAQRLTNFVARILGR